MSQINLTNTQKKTILRKPIPFFFTQAWLVLLFWNTGPVGQRSSWLFWYLGFYLIKSTVNPKLLKSGSVIQRVSNQTWKRNLQKQTLETLIWKFNIWKCNIEDASWTHTHASVKSFLLDFFTASTHAQHIIIIIIIIYYFETFKKY